MIKKLLFLGAMSLSVLLNAQVYSPNGTVGSTISPVNLRSGINTDNPSFTLDVRSNGNTAIGLSSNANSVGVTPVLANNVSSGHFQIMRYNGGSYEASLLRLDLNSGELGVGVSDPKAMLHVNGGTIIEGAVSIGSDSPKPGYQLSVDGKVVCEELLVELSSNWGDFVFAPEYELMPLDSVANYIEVNNHLPSIPAASEIDGEGVQIGEMQRLQMIKIEELTLHMIEINREKEALEIYQNKLSEENSVLAERLTKMEALLAQLMEVSK